MKLFPYRAPETEYLDGIRYLSALCSSLTLSAIEENTTTIEWEN